MEWKRLDISLCYQPYQSSHWQHNNRYDVAGGSNLSLDGNLRKRFGSINYQHAISLSVLESIYQVDNIPVHNNAVLISSIQTVTVNRESYYFSTQYNCANASSPSATFNAQLNAEAGCM